MIQNLKQPQELGVNINSEASRLSSTPSDVKTGKCDTDIFDFDLKSVKLGSGQFIEAKSRLPKCQFRTRIACPY